MDKADHTRVYLRKCRWDGKEFYSEKRNTLYCSAKCRYNAIRQSHNKYDRKYYRRKRKELILKMKGTVDLKKTEKTRPATYLGVTIPGSEWIEEFMFVKNLKKSTLSGTYSKGKQNGPTNSVGHSPYHNHVTQDDLHEFSISYLKENNVRCPECGNRRNEITHGLVICRECGYVLKAPPIHPGYEVDDLIPTWMFAPTIQDLSYAKKKKDAHKLAYDRYWDQVGVLDPEVSENPLQDEHENDWISAWKHYKKVIVKRRRGFNS